MLRFGLVIDTCYSIVRSCEMQGSAGVAALSIGSAESNKS